MNRKYKTIPYHHGDIIDGVQVRLIYPSERKRWDARYRRHHYLGLKAMVGKTLLYAAVFENCRLALIGRQAAALKCKPRDRWIGWSQVIQYQRLHLIALNTHFLILPDLKLRNLVSRVLSLTLKRMPMTGRPFTATQFCRLKPLSRRLVLQEPVTEPQIGKFLVRQKDFQNQATGIV